MLIDCHMHAFADKIADKAVTQLINYYQIPTNQGGKLRDMLKAANQARLDRLILLVAATKPEQVKPANDWILELMKLDQNELKQREDLMDLPCLPKIIPFGTFHPDDPDWYNEVRRLRSRNIKGLKLHPEFQRIDLSNPQLNDFFAEIENDFILMIHIGDPVISPSNYSTPAKVAAILTKFPKIKIIGAHLGGYQFWEEACEVLAGRNLYLDTSSALSYINPQLLRRIISKHGTDHILFGSDYPLCAPQQDLERLERIDWLSSSQKEMIRGGNCELLLQSVKACFKTP